jgi:hypothetical protein
MKALSLALLTLGLTSARKLLETSGTAEHPQVSSPRVLDTQFQFGSSKYYYKLDMTPPSLKVGWQLDQTANSKDLTFQLNPSSYVNNLRLDSSTTNQPKQGTATTGVTKKPVAPTLNGLTDPTVAPVIP